MRNRLFAVIRKEFIQVRRDRRTLGMALIVPVLWLVLFGYAATFDVKNVPLAILDHASNAQGAELVGRLEKTGRFIFAAPAGDREDLLGRIKRGKIIIGLVIPRDFGAGGGGGAGGVEVIVDGSDLFSATTAIRYLQGEIAVVQAAAARAAAARASIPAPPPAPDLKILYNDQLSSVRFMIPALVGMVIMFMTTFLTAMSVVRERENGTLEQIAITPIRPVELMVGKLIPYALIGFLDFWLVLAAAVYVFGIPFAGNIWIFFLMALLFEAATLAVGLLISTVAQNQPQAMQMALLYMIPQFVLSGLIFPLAAMPVWLRWISVVFPLTYFAPISRGMFLKGLGLDILWPQAVILAAFAVVLVAAASLQFRRKMGAGMQ